MTHRLVNSEVVRKAEKLILKALHPSAPESENSVRAAVFDVFCAIRRCLEED